MKKDYTTQPRKAMMMGGNTEMTKAASGMNMKQPMAKGGMPMVEKDGKKVPAFAADGKGKMAYGGMGMKDKMMYGGKPKKS